MSQRTAPHRREGALTPAQQALAAELQSVAEQIRSRTDVGYREAVNLAAIRLGLELPEEDEA